MESWCNDLGILNIALTSANIALLIINIFAIVYQYFPRINCYFYFTSNPRGCFVSVSNNSLMGVYIDKIEYLYRSDIHKLGNPDLSNFRICGDKDYSIRIVDACDVVIVLKHRCYLNGKWRRKITLNMPLASDNNIIIRSQSSQVNSIIIGGDWNE